MKKQPKIAIKEQISKIYDLIQKLKKFKHANGYCAEEAYCTNRVTKGHWGCAECLANVESRR